MDLMALIQLIKQMGSGNFSGLHNPVDGGGRNIGFGERGGWGYGGISDGPPPDLYNRIGGGSSVSAPPTPPPGRPTMPAPAGRGRPTMPAPVGRGRPTMPAPRGGQSVQSTISPSRSGGASLPAARIKGPTWDQ